MNSRIGEEKLHPSGSSAPAMKVAILGSGNIGIDLLIKVMRSPLLECSLVSGRRLESPGMRKARDLGIATSDAGVDAILRDPDCCELVFDATSAQAHKVHWPMLRDAGKTVIDLTPAKEGHFFVPAVDLVDEIPYQNVNMISCGGQTALPLVHVLAKTQQDIEYIEVVSSLASKSAGPATRLNIDEYIETTENAIKAYSGCPRAKVILILNPAEPCIIMQTTISAKTKRPDLVRLKEELDGMMEKIRTYVPGYELVVPPVWERDRILITIRVNGRGDYLPVYAGNLDIINCAAVRTAEAYAKNRPVGKARD